MKDSFELYFTDLEHYEKAHPYLTMLFDFLEIDIDDMEMWVTREGGIGMKIKVNGKRKKIFLEVAEKIPEISAAMKSAM